MCIFFSHATFLPWYFASNQTCLSTCSMVKHPPKLQHLGSIVLTVLPPPPLSNDLPPHLEVSLTTRYLARCPITWGGVGRRKGWKRHKVIELRFKRATCSLLSWTGALVFVNVMNCWVFCTVCVVSYSSRRKAVLIPMPHVFATVVAGDPFPNMVMSTALMAGMTTFLGARWGLYTSVLVRGRPALARGFLATSQEWVKKSWEEDGGKETQQNKVLHKVRG